MSDKLNKNSNSLFHAGIIWLLFCLVFVTDFFTPLGFSHGILYVPVLVYALAKPGFSPWFPKAVLAATIIGTILVYMVSAHRLEMSEIYIVSNRVVTISILLLTFYYFRRLKTIKQQNIAITKLEQAQRRTLEDFMNAMPVQVWWADATGVVDFVGDRLVEFTGKSKSEILADWLALLHPDDRERTLHTWMHAVQTGQAYQVDFRLRRYDGEYIWFDTQAIAQRGEDGSIKRWLGSSMDINQLRRVTKQSEQLAAKYRDTLASITDAFFTLDHEFKFTYLNEKAAELCGGVGSKVADLLGKSIWEQCQLGTQSPFAAKYLLAAETQQKLQFEEYFSPTDRWLDVNVYPYSDGLTVYFSDVTERKALEQRFRESQKLEAVGHLTGGIAHDFNNLLTVIMGNSEMLAEELSDPALRAMATMTLSAAQRGADLTSRLLAFARRKPLNPQATDLNAQIDALWQLIRRTLPENIELTFKAEPELAITEVDAGEFDNALLNLVVNARDAMPGGGKLTIETANTELDEQYAARYPEVNPGEYVMVVVSDSGIGMPPETVSRAFEPFFTTKQVGKGSGLGLSMVFGFTKQSGGHASIYSEPGEGTTVKLYFPKAVKGVPVPATFSTKPQLNEGSEHILIVEDDDLVLQHLQRQLRAMGYRVTAATSGPEALELLSTDQSIQMLLTDIIMPGGMNGRQLADKALALYPKLKILYTSGYTENAIVHQGRLDPGLALLNKPYTRLELATKLRLVFDKN